MVAGCCWFPRMGDIMDKGSFWTGVITGGACISILSLASVITTTGDTFSIPKDGAIKEALSKGVSAQQLQDAFKQAAPEIASGEIKKLAAYREKLVAICRDNAPLLSSRGLDCQQVLGNFKPQGPS